MRPPNDIPDPGLWAQCACIWEATARKVGNVHPGRSFPKLHYLDFLHSAACIAPIFTQASGRPVGAVVLDAIRATRLRVTTNTNLGIVLLLAPLAVVPTDVDLREGLARVLDSLTLQDSQDVFTAIRLAQPGGMGKVGAEDVHNEPTLPLRQVMALAEKHDLIARQYVDGFHAILDDGVIALHNALAIGLPLETAIQFTHLHLMARYPDSLIARKRGLAEAQESSRRAAHVLQQGWPHHPGSHAGYTEFDTWLRAEKQSRNPGTSADLIAACLYVALREGDIALPLTIPWE